MLLCKYIFYLVKIWEQTRTKTSIRYAKENDRDKERKRGRRRYIERGERLKGIERWKGFRGERDIEVKGIERVKGTQSKPNPLPNAFPKLCKWFSGRFLLKGRGTRTVLSLRGKSSWNLPNREIKRKKRLKTKIITR